MSPSGNDFLAIMVFWWLSVDAAAGTTPIQFTKEIQTVLFQIERRIENGCGVMHRNG
ncbi:MAG: hypothetical protein AB1898_16030 [Acidobacteriota bacterium]